LIFDYAMPEQAYGTGALLPSADVAAAKAAAATPATRGDVPGEGQRTNDLCYTL
jgi:hypothetical protein